MTTIRRVHLVYPHGSSISAPDSIGRHLAGELGRHWDVRLHNWSDIGRLEPDASSALVGHAHPVPGTLFRASAKAEGWGRVLMLQPFNGDLRQIYFVRYLVPRVDAWLALSGPYWFAHLADSRLKAWRSRLVRLDLAVDPAEYPRIKPAVSTPGRRKFLYIGGNAPMKNTRYLQQIAEGAPDLSIAWAGAGAPISGLQPLGHLDFQTESARRTLADYDFLLTVGTHDANPTTVLEAMSWGLIPICTAQSGYSDEPGVINVPLGDPSACISTLRHLRDCPAAPLNSLQELNWKRVSRHYTWERFGEVVAHHIIAEPVGIPTRSDSILTAALWASAASSRLAPYRRQGRRMWRDVLARGWRAGRWGGGTDEP